MNLSCLLPLIDEMPGYYQLLDALLPRSSKSSKKGGEERQIVVLDEVFETHRNAVCDQHDEADSAIKSTLTVLFQHELFVL